MPSSFDSIDQEDHRKESANDQGQEEPKNSFQESAKLQENFDQVVPLRLSKQPLPDATQQDGDHRHKRSDSGSNSGQVGTGKVPLKDVVAAGHKSACVGDG
jgi:hypothetical protein